MKRFSFAIAVVATVAFATSAFAQAPVGPSLKLAIVPVGGIAVAAGDASDSYDPSLCIGGELDVKLGPLVAITGSVLFNEFSNKAAAIGITEKAKTTEIGASIKYNIAPTPVAKPFLRFGAAMYSLDFGGAAGSNTEFGISGGAGIDIDLPASKLGFTANARYHNVFVSGAKWKYFNVYGGIRFSLM